MVDLYPLFAKNLYSRQYTAILRIQLFHFFFIKFSYKVSKCEIVRNRGTLLYMFLVYSGSILFMHQTHMLGSKLSCIYILTWNLTRVRFKGARIKKTRL